MDEPEFIFHDVKGILSGFFLFFNPANRVKEFMLVYRLGLRQPILIQTGRVSMKMKLPPVRVVTNFSQRHQMPMDQKSGSTMTRADTERIGYFWTRQLTQPPILPIMEYAPRGSRSCLPFMEPGPRQILKEPHITFWTAITGFSLAGRFQMATLQRLTVRRFLPFPDALSLPIIGTGRHGLLPLMDFTPSA